MHTLCDAVWALCVCVCVCVSPLGDDVIQREVRTHGLRVDAVIAFEYVVVVEARVPRLKGHLK